MIFPPFLPGSATAFVDFVVPELQRRGIYRKDYAGTTLRDHFGLPPPRKPLCNVATGRGLTFSRH